MAVTECPKCGAADFEMEEAVIANAVFKMNFVQCAACGTPVGVTDYDDPVETLTPVIQQQSEKIGQVEGRLSRLEQDLTTALEILRRLQK